MSLADNEHLPKIVTNTLGIKDVLLAIDPEIVQLRQDISDMIKELYVKTTDNYITRWERDFSLTYDSSLNLQQRRQRILNKLAQKKTLNWENLKLLVKNNLVIKQLYIVNDSANYRFRLIIQDPNYQQMEKAVKKAKPAYLTFDILVTEFFRRCGTFTCGTEPL